MSTLFFNNVEADSPKQKFGAAFKARVDSACHKSTYTPAQLLNIDRVNNMLHTLITCNEETFLNFRQTLVSIKFPIAYVEKQDRRAFKEYEEYLFNNFWEKVVTAQGTTYRLKRKNMK